MQHLFDPAKIKGTRLIECPDGTVALSRSHFQAEKILDSQLIRLPNELRWIKPSLTKENLSDLTEVFSGKQVYLVGKGPTLDRIQAWWFEAHIPIIAVNDSIVKVESLGLDNPTFCMVQDAFLKGKARPKKATLIVSVRAAHQYADYPRRMLFTRHDLGVRSGSCITAVAAVRLLRMCGATGVRLVAFDGMFGNTDYAKCLGTDPRKWGPVQRFIGHGVKLEQAIAEAGFSYTHHSPLETRAL